MTFGIPKILQCDKGLEFQGILLLIYCFHSLTGQQHLYCQGVLCLFHAKVKTTQSLFGWMCSCMLLFLPE